MIQEELGLLTTGWIHVSKCDLPEGGAPLSLRSTLAKSFSQQSQAIQSLWSLSTCEGACSNAEGFKSICRLCY